MFIFRPVVGWEQAVPMRGLGYSALSYLPLPSYQEHLPWQLMALVHKGQALGSPVGTR